MKKRIEWIDILRAISMFIVILGHTAIKDEYQKIIYSFHMPLFFFISGLVFNPHKNLTNKQFVKKKFKAYIIPYFWMNIITLPLWIINFKMYRHAEPKLIDLIFGALYSNNEVITATTNAAWFLTTMFLVDICFRFIYMKFYNRPKKLFVIIILLSSLSFIENILFPNFYWPWHLEVVPVGVSLYYVGYLFKLFYDKYQRLFQGKLPIVYSILGLLIGLLLQSKQIRVSMTINRMGDPFLFYVVALSLIIATTCLAMLIKRNKITYFIYDNLTFIGKNTLLYIGLQIPIIRLFEANFTCFTENHRTLYFLLLSFIVFIIIVPITKFIDLYFPFIVSKGNFKSSKNIRLTYFFILLFFLTTSCLIWYNAEVMF